MVSCNLNLHSLFAITKNKDLMVNYKIIQYLSVCSLLILINLIEQTKVSLLTTR